MDLCICVFIVSAILGERAITNAVEPKRYEARHDLPPVFYVSEVERGRAKIRKWLEVHLPTSVDEYPRREVVLGVEMEYCKHRRRQRHRMKRIR